MKDTNQPAKKTNAEAAAEAISEFIKMQIAAREEKKKQLSGIKQLRLIAQDGFRRNQEEYMNYITKFDKQIADLEADLKKSEAVELEMRRIADSVKRG